MQNDDHIIRIFSGTEIEVLGLRAELENIGVATLIQNELSSGLMAGFYAGGPAAVNLFIKEEDFHRAEETIKQFFERNQA